MSDYYETLPRMKTELAFEKKTGRVLNPTRWLEPEKIKKTYGTLKPDHDGIIVGAIDDSLISVKDNMHIMTVAGTRSGKTVNLKNNLFFHKSSVVAIDVKSELARDTAFIRHTELKQDVYIIDPEEMVKNEAKEYRAYFNPLVNMTVDNPQTVDYASKLAESLVVRNQNIKDPFWDDSAHTLIEGVIMHVCSCLLYKKNRDLVTVYKLIALGSEYKPKDKDGKRLEDNDGNPITYTGIEGLIKEMQHNARLLEARAGHHANDENQTIAINCEDLSFLIFAAATDIGERSPKERSGVLSTARRHVSFIRYRQMQNILRAGKYDRTFNLADLKENENGTSIYLCLPPSKLKICSGWLRMFLVLSIAEMEHAKAKLPPDWEIGKPETATGLQTLFILDEFATAIGRLEILKDAAGLVAGSPYDIRLWCVIQDLPQIKNLYSDAWETFVGNCGLITFYNNSDMTTLEYISKRLGKMRTPKISQSEKDKTNSLSLQEMDLVAPQETAIYFGRHDPHKRIIVLSAGERPWAIQKADFWDAQSLVYPIFKRSHEETIRLQQTHGN